VLSKRLESLIKSLMTNLIERTISFLQRQYQDSLVFHKESHEFHLKSDYYSELTESLIRSFIESITGSRLKSL
jgi:hypothetical protein